MPIDTASLTVASDLTCVSCKYNLRTLALHKRCPECGTSVVSSLRSGGLCCANREWLRTVLDGVTGLLIALILITLGSGLVWACRATDTALILLALPGMVGAFLILGGWLNLLFALTPELGAERRFAQEACRRLGRTFLVLLPLTLCLLLVLVPRPQQAAAVACLICAGGGLATTLTWLRFIAQRSHATTLVNATDMVVGAILLCVGLITVMLMVPLLFPGRALLPYSIGILVVMFLWLLLAAAGAMGTLIVLFKYRKLLVRSIAHAERIEATLPVGAAQRSGETSLR